MNVMLQTNDMRALVAEAALANDARALSGESAEDARQAAEAANPAYDETIGRLIRARASTIEEILAKARALKTAMWGEAALDRALTAAPCYPCEARDRAIALSILRDIVDLDGGAWTRIH
jgi:hypothetical protein